MQFCAGDPSGRLAHVRAEHPAAARRARRRGALRVSALPHRRHASRTSPTCRAETKAALLDELLRCFDDRRRGRRVSGAASARSPGDPAHVRLVQQRRSRVRRLSRAPRATRAHRAALGARDDRRHAEVRARCIRTASASRASRSTGSTATTSPARSAICSPISGTSTRRASARGSTRVLRERCRAFAEALQTVNILKDVARDAEHENSIYIPEQLLRAHGSATRRSSRPTASRETRAALGTLRAARVARPRSGDGATCSRSRAAPSRSGSSARCRCCSPTPRCAISRARPDALARREVVKISRSRGEVAHAAERARRARATARWRDWSRGPARKPCGLLTGPRRDRLKAPWRERSGRGDDRAEERLRPAPRVLPALEPVEQLLQRELRPRDDAPLKRARAARSRSPARRRPARPRRGRSRRSRTATPTPPTRHRCRPIACRRRLRAVTAEIRVEPDVHRDRRRRRTTVADDLERLRQRVVAAADLERALEPDEKILTRLPHDAVGVMALDDQQFLPLHPRVDRGEHVRAPCPERCAPRARGSDRTGSPRNHARPPEPTDRVRSSASACRRLCGDKPDFLAELDQLLLGELLVGVAACRSAAPRRARARAPARTGRCERRRTFSEVSRP